MIRIVLIAVCLLACLASPILAVTRLTVVTTGGGDYTTLAAAYGSCPDPFTDDVVITCSGTTDDTTPVAINHDHGAYSLMITGASDPGGVWHDDYYVLGPMNSANVVDITSDNVTLDKLQLTGGVQSLYGANVAPSAGNVVIKNCVFKTFATGNNAAVRFSNGASATGRVLVNCVIYASKWSVYCHMSEATVAHCTITGATGYGLLVNRSGDTLVTLKNNLISGSGTADYAAINSGGTLTTAYTYTSDTSSPDGHGSKTFTFVGAADFHLDPGQNGLYGCTNPGITGLTADVDGDTRVDWDAGFDELVNPAGPSGTILGTHGGMLHGNYRRRQ